MKKIILGMVTLTTVAFGESTGVHNSKYGNNQIDVHTKAFIVNSGLVITASAGTANPVTDAIKSVTLNHGTLMAGGTNLSSVASRDVYIRKVSGANFAADTVINIKLEDSNSTQENRNNLIHNEDESKKIPHTLEAKIGTGATYNAGSNASDVTDNKLQISSNKSSHDGDFKTIAVNNIPVTLTSTIGVGGISQDLLEGAYQNTSTLAVRFSKIPASNTAATENADYTTSGIPDNQSTAKETAGIGASI